MDTHLCLLPGGGYHYLPSSAATAVSLKVDIAGSGTYATSSACESVSSIICGKYDTADEHKGDRNKVGEGEAVVNYARCTTFKPVE
jgi:hypothetical protein